MPSAARSTSPSTPPPQPLAALRSTALDASTIGEMLRTDGGDWRVAVVETTGSTSSDLLASIRDGGYASPALLVAERQTAGRGRLGRRWTSTAGVSVTASYALRVERPLAALEGATLVCGLAVRNAIARHGVEARLKWPNDLLVDGRKVAGILVEATPVPGGTVLVVGVGVNVEAGGEAIDRSAHGLPATDLRTAGGRAVDRNRLVAGIAAALRARLAVFASDGFAATADEWNRHDAFGDRTVSLQAGPDERTTGIARGVDRGGALLIDTAGGRRRIVSGDVSVRLADAP